MVKRWIVLLLAVALALAVVPLAAAGNGGGAGKGKLRFELVDPGARLCVVTAEGCTTATLAVVPLGAKVKVRGRVDRSGSGPANLVYVALDVKARVAAEPTPEP